MLLNPVPLAAYVAFTGRTENYTQPRTISEPNLFELGIRKLRSRIPQSAGSTAVAANIGAIVGSTPHRNASR
jgi:hypothetical protein